MSLILDALNKADTERDPEATPSLSSNHDRPHNAGDLETNRQPMYIAGAVAGLLIIVLIIWLFSGGEEQKSTPTNAPSQLTQSNSVSESPTHLSAAQGQNAAAPQITQQPALPQSQNANTTKKVIAQQYERVDAAVKTTKPTATSSTKSKETKTNSASQIAAIYSQPEEKIESTPKPKVNRQQQKEVAIAVPNYPTLADYGTLSFIGDLPYSKQKSIPTLMYTDHNYSPGSTTVTINKVTRRKGDTIATGLVLEDIVEDGVVLHFQSKLRFKMMAFNSWINM
ncbi:MAG: general secretion pathway protein GspB [Agarilytica sp.]